MTDYPAGKSEADPELSPIEAHGLEWRRSGFTWNASVDEYTLCVSDDRGDGTLFRWHTSIGNSVEDHGEDRSRYVAMGQAVKSVQSEASAGKEDGAQTTGVLVKDDPFRPTHPKCPDPECDGLGVLDPPVDTVQCSECTMNLDQDVWNRLSASRTENDILSTEVERCHTSLNCSGLIDPEPGDSVSDKIDDPIDGFREAIHTILKAHKVITASGEGIPARLKLHERIEALVSELDQKEPAPAVVYHAVSKAGIPIGRMYANRHDAEVSRNAHYPGLKVKETTVAGSAFPSSVRIVSTEHRLLAANEKIRRLEEHAERIEALEAQHERTMDSVRGLIRGELTAEIHDDGEVWFTNVDKDGANYHEKPLTAEGLADRFERRLKEAAEQHNREMDQSTEARDIAVRQRDEARSTVEKYASAIADKDRAIEDLTERLHRYQDRAVAENMRDFNRREEESLASGADDLVLRKAEPDQGDQEMVALRAELRVYERALRWAMMALGGTGPEDPEECPF